MPPPDQSCAPARVFDCQLWLAVIVAACVVMPRTTLVSSAHSEYWDDQYHLRHGLALIQRVHPGDMRQDAPLGQALLALPLLAMGVSLPGPDHFQAHPDAPPFPAVLYLAKDGPETLSWLVALWKALLFLPFAGLVFHWCRHLYGLRGGWLGLALVLVEPTIAGHVAPAALDVLEMEVGLFACYLAWRYFESATTGRLVAAGVAVAAAMLTKHTAIITPGVVALFALAHWLRDRITHPQQASLRRRVNQLFAGALVAVAAIWPLTLFDVSRPSEHGPVINAVYTEGFSFNADVVNGALMRPWPAGVYIGSIRGGQLRSEGHDSYLWGDVSQHGWWYYFPAVALYKVPLGVALVIAVALASLLYVRPRFDETPLAIAAVCWAIFLTAGGIHVGFRHILPAYVPLLMLCARCALIQWDPARWLPWLGVAATAVHSAFWHPDYLSYINFPRDKPYLAISDSNIDWGQSLKQVRRWLDEHPQGDRPVSIGYFGNMEGHSVRHHLRQYPFPRVKELKDDDPAPTSGLLIISPVWIAGAYGHDQYAFLRHRTPDAVIGHNMLVYDLDRPASRPADRLAN
jgi:hypothetical protein